MSGICGLAFSSVARKVDRRTLEEMARSLPFDPHPRTCVETYGPVGLGAHVVPNTVSGVIGTTAMSQQCPLALAFYGTLFDGCEELSVGKSDMEDDRLWRMLNWYEREGLQFLSRLRGEFVMALWDGRDETLYLACDRFRIHPLFYYYDDEKLVFSSRMRGITSGVAGTDLSISHAAILDLVTNSFIPTPQTIYQEVKKLPPGMVLRFRRGEMHLTPYWDISFLEQSRSNERELTEQLRTVFAESLSVRVAVDQSRNALGSFLSGGVDSTTVTGLLAQTSARVVKSFSIGFGEDRYNEIMYARIAAQAFPVEPYEYFVSPHDVAEALPVLMESFDEPFGNASSIPTYFCAKLAQEHGVSVLYAGDGGDELFAGNARYHTQYVFQAYSRLPVWFRKWVVEPLVFALAEHVEWTILLKGKNYIQRATTPYPDRLFAYNMYEEVPKHELFASGIWEKVGRDYDPFHAHRLHYSQAPARTELERQLYMDLKLAIADNDLFKVTRMAECAGVAVRFPFLDHRLAEFAATIPACLKMRRGKLRSFFKQAYADLLPPQIQTKHKHGFGLPIPIWLRTDRRLNEMMQDLVLSPTGWGREYFRKATLEKIVERHRVDPTGFYGTILWNVMMLELWQRTHALALKSS